MGNAVSKSENMGDKNNSDGVYENMDSLGEEIAMQNGIAKLKDSMTSEIRKSMNEVVAVLVDNLRVQEDVLAALTKNKENMEQIISIMEKLSSADRDTKNEQKDSENKGWPKGMGVVQCFRCGKFGHIRRNCKKKFNGD